MKKVLRLVLSVLFIALVGCTEEKVIKLDEWEESATFVREVIVTDDGQTDDFVFRIGDNGKFGIGEYGPFIADQAQKYMWHFWGEQELITKPFKVVGISKETKVELTVFKSPGGGSLAPNSGADHHLPSSIKLPSPGYWKLIAYFDDNIFGSIIVNVEEN